MEYGVASQKVKATKDTSYEAEFTAIRGQKCLFLVRQLCRP
jgi:hypothetical protein